jgi:hypothetical protein
MSAPRRSRRSLRYDRDAELRLIAEARRLAASGRTRSPESVESVMAFLERQQRVAACRALDRPLEA